MTRMPPAAGIRVATAAAVVLGPLWGCSPDFQDGVGPRVSSPDVEGTVKRATAPAPALDVELRVASSEEVLFATESDDGGQFSFFGVSTGRWEVKISGESTGDFASVSREFERADASTPSRLPVLDIFAYGAGVASPAGGARVPGPSPVQPLVFRWVNPDMEPVLARVLLYDADGKAVWFSTLVTADSALWNGVGNQGAYEGKLTPTGSYQWRVKFDLPDTSEARTERRLLSVE